MNKTKYCPVHCFNYTGTKCPFCEQERINRMVQKHQKFENSHVDVEEQEEITQESLDNLLAKFNNR